MNWSSCVMKPSRSIAPLVVGRAGLLDELVQVGEFALAEEFGEEHGVVAGAIERFVEQRGDRHAVFDRAEMANRFGRGGDFRRFFVGASSAGRVVGERGRR